MKKLIVFGILAFVFVGFSSCGGKETEKSKACEITLFSAGGVDWNIDGLNISATFAKGTIVSALLVTIEHSELSTVTPASGSMADFSGDKAVTYTVTAEDGITKKVYTARATISTTP